jgi:3-phenylpropionate/trans-cinnamate dioxygenase ferredoxin reductase subunit
MPAVWYDHNRVETVRATVARVHVAEHRLELDTGAVVDHAKLLIATGGRNRRFDTPGAELEGVFQLRTVADCDAIRASARPNTRALIVGMGFIGCEVAASLRVAGMAVTAVFPGTAPLESPLGSEIGKAMAALHTQHGVELIAGDSVARFEGRGRVQRAVTKTGRTLECDFAVVAVGIQPNVEFLVDAGIALENGILVDGSCRTNGPDVFAAGDVANHLHPLFGRVRVEHYNNAEKQGAAAARSMLGSEADYDYLHTFWSDQYDDKLEYVGHASRWDQFVVRGSLEDRRLVGFYLEDGFVRAAVGLNRGGDPELDADGEMAQAARLIRRRARPPAADLMSDDGDLDAL